LIRQDSLGVDGTGVVGTPPQLLLRIPPATVRFCWSGTSNILAEYASGRSTAQPSTEQRTNNKTCPVLGQLPDCGPSRMPFILRTTGLAMPVLLIMSPVTFYNQSKQSVLGDAIAIADTAATRNRGLLKHDCLNEGEGLWIVPCEAVHTFWMKFAIDCVFLDKHKRVTKVVANLRPSRLAMSWRARSVLELPAGMAAQTRTEAGDQIEIRRPQA
jgi:uncharacterized membrane protein (UPF0127 family)